MSAQWKAEIRKHARRLRNVVRYARSADAPAEPVVRAAAYRELLLRAARLQRLLAAKNELAPLLGLDHTPLERTLAEATSLARSMARDGSSQRFAAEFWSIRTPDKDRQGERGRDRAEQALVSVFDQEAVFLLAWFARQHQLPLPPGQPDRTERAELDPGETRLVARWLQRYRLRRMAFGPSREDHQWTRMLMFDVDDAAQNRIRATVNKVMGSLARDQVGPDLLPRLKQLIDELATRVEEVGFDGLIESLGGGALQPDMRSWVNVVPGEERQTCAPAVVALVRGWKGRYAWSKSLAALRTHLIGCLKVTRMAVVLADVWDAASFAKDFAPDVHALRPHGVQLVVLLGGAAHRGLSPLELE